MPSRTLPTFLQTDIVSRNTAKSCYVTMGTKVYDITDFLDSHPGGEDLILEYGGKDITDILKNETSHTHSEAAYEILDDSLVGFVATEGLIDPVMKSKQSNQVLPLPPTQTCIVGPESNSASDGLVREVYATTGMSSEEDLSKETDAVIDYKTHKFLDLNRPLIPQVWFGGFSKDFYLAQVHRPRHYKGGESAPLFGNFLEPLTKTAWYIVPILWLPPVVYGTYIAREGCVSWAHEFAFWGLGLFLWTFVEYMLHRFLFHLDDFLPDNRGAITLHFLLHGIHHYLPMDRLRLVMPPTLFLALAIPFWKLTHIIFFWNWHAATAVFCGGVFGYICYDITHYSLHHKTLPSFWRELKKYHLQHHFMDYENGFGVTSRFWDVIFANADTVISGPLLTSFILETNFWGDYRKWRWQT